MHVHLRSVKPVAVPLALVALTSLAFGAFAACDDTPRGEQGIDFLADGGYYSVPPASEAGSDATAPCVEDGDAGVCAQVSTSGTPATHLIVCVVGTSPLDIQCVTPPGAVPDAGTFCCTTGLL